MAERASGLQALSDGRRVSREPCRVGDAVVGHHGCAHVRSSLLSGCAPAPSWVVTFQVACHAGGRGFESRHSRSTKPLQTSVLSCLLRRDQPSLKGSFAAPGPREAGRPPRRTPAKCPFHDRAEWAKAEEARKTGQTLGPHRHRRCPSSGVGWQNSVHVPEKCGFACGTRFLAPHGARAPAGTRSPSC